ncbi:MAG: ABC transporter permease [Candidatus Wallbacteria bacterium]|nr:ABC transporter permease [Candidatus Wallbacteria bacterium]
MKTLTDLAGRTGNLTFSWLALINRFSRFAADSFRHTFVAPLLGKRRPSAGETFRQMVVVGVDSSPIVITIAMFIGMILAMQTAYQLKKYGIVNLVGDLVAVSITRELGPLITAIIIAGRIGASYAAEIGTMKVAEELDALRSMALNPVRYLVSPRLLAMLVMLPCLTVFANLTGIFGGFIISVFNLGLSPVLYYNHVIEALVLKDIATGLMKSLSFAGIIVLVGCYQGFTVENGAEGVGRNTTNSVVASIFLIILADCFFTALFYFAF